MRWRLSFPRLDDALICRQLKQTQAEEPVMKQAVIAVLITLGLGGCVVATVADTAATVVGTAVEATADVVGGAVDLVVD